MATHDAKAVIPDSNVWIAVFRKEDSQRPKAMRVFDELEGAEIVVPEYVLIEVASILKLKGHEKEARAFIMETLNSERGFLAAGSLAYETAKLFCERHDKLSFIDTALLVLSRDYRVITFDKALGKALA